MMTSYGEFWYTISGLVLIALVAAVAWEGGRWWAHHQDNPAVQRMHHMWDRIRHGH